MKRIGPLHLLAVIGLVASCATAANAGSRCSDEPEPCVKSTASLSRPVARVAANPATQRVQPALQPEPAPPPAPVAKKAAAPARKAVAKAQRTTPTPTPGMGMLLKLSNGNSDISWLPSNGGETQRQKEKGEAQGQSWVL